MGKDTVLAAIDQAFGGIPRPEIMTSTPTHCEECEDHERVMKSVTPLTVSLEEIGMIGWDPVHFLTDDAYRYFMPGFVRLSVNREDGFGYIDQFTSHLERRVSREIFTPEQRRAVIQLIDYLTATINEELVVKSFLPTEIEELGRIRDKLEAMQTPS